MSYTPPPGAPPLPPTSEADEEERRRGVAWWVWAVLGVLALLVVVLAVLLLRRGGAPSAGPGEIFLEPAADPGPASFTPPLATPPPARIAGPALPAPQASSGGVPAITAQSGGTPGLYGGTRNLSSCDSEQLIAFLANNPSLGRAWAQVHGITTAEIPTYVRGLTPVILRSDTRVTNHGYSAGQPTPRQSVLQAGTAVLIDQYGVPRVRCYCGNPLLPPIAAPTTPVYRGAPWPGFSQTNVTVIQNNTTAITVIQLIDVNTGEPFGRPIGGQGPTDLPAGPPQSQPPPSPTPTPTPTPTPLPTFQPPVIPVPTPLPPQPPPPPSGGLELPPDVDAGTGDVQVTLLWQGPADLDLHVTDPTGAEVSFSSPSSPSGGTLDVDANAGCSSSGSGSTNVENIFWPTGGAPSGTYTATVVNFGACGAGSIPYQLRVTVNGAVVYNQGATFSSSDTQSGPVTFTR